MPDSAAVPDFTLLPDLALRTVGGSVVWANDETFAEKENLIRPEPPGHRGATFGNKGQVYDGWETRRRQEAGVDEAIIRLGIPGVIYGVVVDTSWFKGNYPSSVSVSALAVEGYPSADELAARNDWTTIVDHVKVYGDTKNSFDVRSDRRWTHVMLSLHPDGGVARLRAYGTVIPDPKLWENVTVEVSGVEHGGRVEWCSDSFYSHACALIAPDRPSNMGDGWETRRRRDVGPETHDAVMISFAVPTDLRRLEIDTSCFVFNASTEVSVLGSRDRPDDERGWALVPFDVPVLDRMRLAPDARQMFAIDVRGVTALRVQAYPDGGIARVRALGTPTEAGVAQLHRQWEASTEAGQ